MYKSHIARLNLRKRITKKKTISSNYAIKTLSTIEFTRDQLSIILSILSRITNKKAVVFYSLHFYKNITANGANARMGKGKGPVVKEAYPLYRGDIILEFTNVTELQATNAFIAISKKIGLRVQLV